MYAQIYRSSLRVYGFFIPNQWADFWLFMGLGLACLLVSAILARVKIGSFPVNPIYWHYWVIIKATKAPFLNAGVPRIYHPYMLFWAGSLCLVLVAFLVLIAIFSSNS